MPTIKLTHMELEWYAGDLERQNKELRAQLTAAQAETWMPVAVKERIPLPDSGDGFHYNEMYFRHIDPWEHRHTWVLSFNDSEYWIKLPIEWAICRRVPAASDP